MFRIGSDAIVNAAFCQLPAGKERELNYTGEDEVPRLNISCSTPVWPKQDQESVQLCDIPLEFLKGIRSDSVILSRIYVDLDGILNLIVEDENGQPYYIPWQLTDQGNGQQNREDSFNLISVPDTEIGDLVMWRDSNGNCRFEKPKEVVDIKRHGKEFYVFFEDSLSGIPYKEVVSEQPNVPWENYFA